MSSVDIGLTAGAASLAPATTRDTRRAGVEKARRGGIWLLAYVGAMMLGAAFVTSAAASAIEAWTPATCLLLTLLALSALWISGGAACALIGLLRAERAPPIVADSWRPAHSTAVLALLCGEAAEPLADYLGGLRRRANELGMADCITLFVLSDTRGAAAIAAEEAALAELVADGSIVYRRRRENIGRKPGNIADWFETHGNAFPFMVVLDADSRMTARRIRSLIARMERDPRLGLLQAGISMVPGRSLFGRHQRLANRLLSPNFGRGLAAWAGDAGNYWGHNAIMRTAAFRCATALPVLSGPAPFGGPPLSHDFVEAAWIRRAGWAVALDPDTRGSAEDGPQTLGEFYRRDRRWCQGNLQHLRIIGEPGLDPVSRLHLASGIASYLVAPMWLALVLLVASNAVVINGALPLLVIALILIVPKACALVQWIRRARSIARRRLLLRASLSECLLSTLIAPLVMLRQSAAVLSVLMGRDCGWKSQGVAGLKLPAGLGEFLVGASLLVLGATTGSAMWLLPVTVPLLSAPLLTRWLDRGAP